MIDGKNFFDQQINNMFKTYENIRKITTSQGDDYTTGCLLDYTYFKIYYKIIAIDLSKLQALDADPRAIQQINFTENLDRANTRIYFILEEAKETIFEFSQGTVKVYECNFFRYDLVKYKVQFNFYQYKMTQYNSLNVKLSNSQLNKFKSAIKNETEIVLRLSSNMIGDNNKS